MGIRTLTYISLLLEDLIKADKNLTKSPYLPPVLPLVIYNGQEPWTAPLSLNAFLPPYLPSKLKAYQPNLTYWLLDEVRCRISLEGSDDFLSPLLAMESAKDPEEIKAGLNHLFDLLEKAPSFESLRRACTVFCAHVLKIKEQLPDFDYRDLSEAHIMLSDRLDSIMENYGQKFLVQGRLEGKLKGELNLVHRLISKKFGKITKAQEEHLNSLSEKQITALFDRLLDAQSLDEAFKH